LPIANVVTLLKRCSRSGVGLLLKVRKNAFKIIKEVLK
jgi:hypothetical protein